MKILFLARRFVYFRNFESVLRELAGRGHAIHLAVEKENEEGRPLVEALARDCPSITYGEAPARADDDWNWVAEGLRYGLDYLRYQHPMFDDTPKLRDRSRERAPGAFVAFGNRIRRHARWARVPASALLRWLERTVPEDDAVRAYVEQQRPDVLLITPLITIGSSQIDYLRSARSLGIPSALCVWSWDHLSSKALIRDLPDQVFVWNDVQKREAIELHRVPEARIVVTGAQCFDKWFDRQPSRDRRTFCREVGLPDDQPFILYTCSAPFLGSQPEAPFVVDWIQRIRASSSPRLQQTPILVRPHPSRRAEWDASPIGSFADVTLFGSSPIDARSQADYFDSLFHSSVVVGLNTSAFIEAAIVGRPVHTILLPEWYESQMGTVHFRYLFEAGGGLLVSAKTFDEHLQQLDEVLAHPTTEVRPFVRTFVRPHGLDVAATPMFATQVEAMSGARVAPPRRPLLESLGRSLLRKSARSRTDIRYERWLHSERDLKSIVAIRELREEKRRVDRAAKKAKVSSVTTKATSATEATTDSSLDSRAFRAYARARDAVLAMKRAAGAAGGAADPSAYWAEELQNIDYMIDASLLIVRKLRHHSFHLTGIRPYDYRSKADSRQEYFEARLTALRDLAGDDLLVPESPALGGFGYTIDGRLFNLDTIKFFEVLIAMERGGVLPALRTREHPVVCEIGAGWGGFAYQFKTLFPRSTVVIVDFPELFLFSGTYLGTMFPDARFAFLRTPETPSIEHARGADFIFVPHTSAADIARLSPDLVANMVSFQEMTDAQVKQYATIAATANCPLLYSLNRERSAYNNELDSVSEALSTCYDLTEVQVLGTDYTAAMKKPPSPKKPVERTELNYRHLVGRLASAAATTGPRVVLGMTLHNNAPNLRKAMDSLLAQTSRDFALVMLDDASEDETEAIAREYEARDARVRYFRHAARKAMIATWHEVVEIASREYPSAEYFAWVSDHDQWHPQWLARLRSELDNDRDAVLAYPITRRIDVEGDELDKGPRLFDTAGRTDRRARWKQWCHSGVGAGDMVYGLMRLDALRRAGIFRRVLRPDRLLIAELTLQGSFRQVPEALWFRRQSHASSVDRQRHTLVLAGDEPPWFGAPPWLQHSAVLWREYARPDPRPIAISRARWVGMLLRYQLTYGWRHFRKTETSHSIGRGIDNVVWSKKQVKHYARLAVFHTLVGSRKVWGQTRRGTRRAVYETLMLTHRLGLRGPGKSQ